MKEAVCNEANKCSITFGQTKIDKKIAEIFENKPLVGWFVAIRADLHCM